MQNDKKEKLFLFSADLARFETEGLRIDAMGLYIGAVFKGRLRLTVEGTQLVGPFCTKGIVTLTTPEMQSWISGANMALPLLDNDPGELDHSMFAIVRSGDDWLGCGRVDGDLLVNYVPKTRWVHALYNGAEAEIEENIDDENEKTEESDTSAEDDS